MVIAFLQPLRDTQIPAWQRLQAVRAIESYRNLVLNLDVPCLEQMRGTLQRLATRERNTGLPPASSATTAKEDRELIGHLDPNESQIVRDCRAELRLMHYALDTERAYIGWIERFIKHSSNIVAQRNSPALVKGK